jgi:hypothetical protein
VAIYILVESLFLTENNTLGVSAIFRACVESGILDGYTSRIYYDEWTEDAVSFRNLFTELEDNHGLKVTPALSRPDDNKKWYAQDAMQRD